LNTPYTPTIGDVFRITLGSGYRLFINGVFRHERVTGLTPLIAYPAGFQATMNGSFLSGSPAIPPPRLEGDWRLVGTAPLVSGEVVTFIPPSHGSIAHVTSSLTADFFNGSVPGQYTLAAMVRPGVNVWVQDGDPAGSSVTSSGGSWVWGATSPPPRSGTNRLKAPNAAGAHNYTIQAITDTLQINKDDVMSVWVFLDNTNPPTEVMIQWKATDGAAFEHRAYWGANSIALGTDGTASRRFMGALPALNQWVQLEVPASIVDLEGRVLNGISFDLFNGICSFDEAGKYPGKLQRAEATIIILALEVLGPLIRTIQPGTQVRFQTNYDVADTDIVTWSVVSGSGSFTAGEFFVPAAPGTTVVRATSGNQSVDLTLNIPAVITPDFGFIGPSEQIDWDTNIVSPIWSASAGVINSGTGVWIAPASLGQTIKITATDGTFIATREVLVMRIFPLGDPTLPVTWDRNLTALISMSEDRTSRITREKAPPYDSYPIKFTQRSLQETNDVDAFFDAHGFGKLFILEDKLRGIRKVGWFDSPIRHEGQDECAIDLSFQFLEARL
jgi:hypothetical protein